MTTMSTTITSAFRLSNSATDLFTVAEELRAVTVPNLSDKFRREAVHLAIREFDSAEYINSGWHFSKFLQTSLNELRRNLGGEITTYDKYDLMAFHRILSFKATFLRNKVRNETYVLLGEGLNKAGEEQILELDSVVSDFSYWNSSDSQVALIGEKEWYRRRDSWKETLDRELGIPQQGITVEMFEKLSAYRLTGWRSNFEGNDEYLVKPSWIEERFRRIVFNTYLESLRKVYPDLNIMDAVNSSWQFLNPNKERNFDILPYSEEQRMRLEDAISFAETRTNAFPIEF